MPNTQTENRVRSRIQLDKSAEENSSPSSVKNSRAKIADSRSKANKRGNPKWGKGVSGNPVGRVKGQKNKFSLAQYKQAAAAGELPLEFMLNTMRNDHNPIELRLQAATAAAPYLHKKQPIGIEQVPGQYGSLTPSQIKNLPTAKLEQLLLASRQFYGQLVQLGVTTPAGNIIDVTPV